MSDVPTDDVPTEATREEVLAWIGAGNGGYSKAAAHFGLPMERVKRWVARAKEPTPVKSRETARKAAPTSTRGNTTPKASTRPVDPEDDEEGDGPRGGYRKPSLRRKGLLDVENLTPALRSNLRDGAWGLARFLARVAEQEREHRRVEEVRHTAKAEGMTDAILDEVHPLPPLMDMRQVDAAARGLKTVFEIAPALAGFDSETGGVGDTGEIGAEERRAMDAVMGEPVAKVGTLTTLPGGRAEVG